MPCAARQAVPPRSQFHQVGRGQPCFEGWYFKLVDAEGAQPYAIIPGVFLGADAHAFVQVLDGHAGTSAYHRFPLSEFQADKDAFAVRIGRCRFDRSGIALAIDKGEAGVEQAVQGEVRFSGWTGWPVRWTSPGVMGPYSFVPFMECNHGILSLDHGLEGALVVGERETRFDGGRGYVRFDPLGTAPFCPAMPTMPKPGQAVLLALLLLGGILAMRRFAGGSASAG